LKSIKTNPTQYYEVVVCFTASLASNLNWSMQVWILPIACFTDFGKLNFPMLPQITMLGLKGIKGYFKRRNFYLIRWNASWNSNHTTNIQWGFVNRKIIRIDSEIPVTDNHMCQFKASIWQNTFKANQDVWRMAIFILKLLQETV